MMAVGALVGAAESWLSQWRDDVVATQTENES